MTNPALWPINRLQFEFTRLHISWTRPRNEIYLALQRLGPCQTIDLVAPLRHRVSRRTIFRTVNLFLELGIATRIGHRLIELAPPHHQRHHYLKCTKCGRRISFYDDTLEKALTRLATRRQFALSTRQIELTGRCSHCRFVS